MQLLRTFDGNEAAWELARLLESHGIPAYVRQATGGFRTGLRFAEVSTYLDSQFEEALKLLDDPDYVVQNPVDIESFNRQVEEFDHSIVLTKTLLILVAAIVFAALVAVVAYFTYRPIEKPARPDWVSGAPV